MKVFMGGFIVWLAVVLWHAVVCARRDVRAAQLAAEYERALKKVPDYYAGFAAVAGAAQQFGIGLEQLARAFGNLGRDLDKVWPSPWVFLFAFPEPSSSEDWLRALPTIYRRGRALGLVPSRIVLFLKIACRNAWLAHQREVQLPHREPCL
jgi:hypothetical protein